MPRSWTQLARTAPWPADAPCPGAIVEATAAAKTLKQDHRSTVQRVTPDLSHAQPWLTKTYHLSPAKHLALSLVRATPAWRELRAFVRLRRAGLRIPEPVALVADGRTGRQWLVMAYLDAPALDHVIGGAELDPAARRRIAGAVGEQVGRLLRAGLVNRDHKVSNLLIDAACRDRGEPPIMVDPLGLRRRDPLRVGRVHRMLARLLETAVKAGPIRRREVVTTLRAAYPEAPWHALRSLREDIATAYRRMNGPPL